MTKFIYYFPLFIILIFFSCKDSDDGTFGTIDEELSGSGLVGWEIDETNTGLARAGLTEYDLTPLDFSSGEDSGKGTINYEGVNGNIYVYANQTIENKIISPTYQLNLTAGNVAIKNCLIQPTNSGNGLPLIIANDAVVENCDIDASLLGTTNIAIAISGRITGCNIWASVTGISINNNGSPEVSICEENYIHDLEGYTGAHMDGITTRISSGAGTVIRNNRSDASWTIPSLVTGAMFLQSNDGYLDNVLIEGNLFEGHGYTLVMGVSTYEFGDNIHVINNRFNPHPDAWGAVSIDQSQISIAEWVENYYYDPSSEDCKGSIFNL